MEPEKMLKMLFDSWDKPIVFVATDHIIRFMNSSAKNNYRKWGNIIGKSIFDCHNERSCEIIKDVFVQLEKGEEEVLIVNNQKHRIYMRGIRDENGSLVGYFERYEPALGK